MILLDAKMGLRKTLDMLAAIRFLLALIWFFGASAVLLVMFLFRPFDIKNGLLWAKVVPPFGLKILGLSIEVRGLDKVKTHHPAVLIGNHQHALDLFVHGYIQSVPTASIGKREIVLVPFFGWLYVLSGQILINRKDRSSAIGSMNKALKEMNSRQLSIWLFPEGTRSHSYGIKKFKKGAFHLAIAAQRPLIPIVSSSFYNGLININKWRAGHIIIETLDPIPTAGLTANDVDSLIERTHQIMSQALDRISEDSRKAIQK